MKTKKIIIITKQGDEYIFMIKLNKEFIKKHYKKDVDIVKESGIEKIYKNIKEAIENKKKKFKRQDFFSFVVPRDGKLFFLYKNSKKIYNCEILKLNIKKITYEN